MGSTTICKPCSLVDERISAVKWCVDCDDPLCDKCVQIHRGMKITMKHQITEIGAASVVSRNTMSLLKECAKHPPSSVDFFCLKHEAVCCRRCMTDEHRLCEKIVPLEDASQKVKQSSLLLDTSKDLKYIHTTLQDFIKNRKITKENINTKENRIRKSITELKKSLAAQLDEIEKSSLIELDDICRSAIEKIEREENQAEMNVRLIETYLQQREFMTENGSDQLLFTFLNFLQPKIKREHDTLEEVITRASVVDIMFEQKENPLQGMKKIGPIQTRITPCDIKLIRLKDIQAQEISFAHSKAKNLFTHKHDFDGKFQWVTAIDVDMDNNVVLVDKSNLKMYSQQGNYKNRCVLDGECWDLSCHKKSSRIVVTIQEEGLQIIDDFVPHPKISVSGLNDCRGVTFFNDNIAIGGKGKIIILNFNGNYMKTIVTETTRVIYYLHYNQSKFYFTDFKNNVYSIRDDGTKSSTMTVSKISGAEAVTTDRRGNLYVAGRKSSNVVRLDQGRQGSKSSEEVFKTENEVTRPYAVCFSKDYTTFFVSSRDGKDIKTFICDF